MNKKQARLKRAKKCRMKIRELGVPRLCVHKTPCHIYVQVISDLEGKVLVCASSVEKGVRESITKMNNIEIASFIGKLIAERVLSIGIKKVAFDRSGFKYHGRIKAFAEAVRVGGIEF